MLFNNTSVTFRGMVPVFVRVTFMTFLESAVPQLLQKEMFSRFRFSLIWFSSLVAVFVNAVSNAERLELDHATIELPITATEVRRMADVTTELSPLRDFPNPVI